jgi:phosphohistidine phosphatase SixA
MPKAGTARSSAALAKAILSSETMIQNAKAYGRFLERAVAAKQKLDKALQVLQAIDSAEKLLAHGTAMPKEQQEADAVREQSERAKTDAEEQADALSIFEWTVVTGDATRAGDDNGLFAIDAHLIALSHTFEASAKTLTAEADELDVQVAQLGQSMYTELLAAITPDGEDDVSNAIAGATYASLGPLFGAVRAAAQNYRDAAETLNTLALTARDLSDSAEDSAWDVLRMRAEQRYHAEHDRK